MKKTIKTLGLSCTMLTFLSCDGGATGEIIPFQGAKMAGRAGVGAAFADKDATVGNINPALMALAGNVVSLDPGVAFVKHRLDYVVPAIPPIRRIGYPGVNVRALGPQTNKYKTIPLLFGGFNYQIDCDLSFGMSFTANDISFVKYKHNFIVPSNAAPAPILARIPGSGPGNTYVKTVAPQLNNILAWKRDDRQAYALNVILAYKYFKSNLLGPEGQVNPHSGKTDNIFGAGLKLGGWWNLLPCLDFGLTIGTPIFFQRLKHYKTLFSHKPNEAWNGLAGLAWHVTPETTLGFDVEGLLTRDEEFYGDVAPEGLGWKNTINFKFAVEQKILCGLTGRIGYDYGPTPIKKRSVFNNGFVNPVDIGEHLIGIGLTYAIDQKFDIDLAGNYAFKNKITDNGKNTPGGISKGMKVQASGSSIMLGFNYKY